MAARASGFTLIEVAIALVIVGLLLGGILRAQELVYGAKVKNLANDFRVVPAYLYAYQDKYRATPGDDAAAASHVPGARVAAAAALGNGGIDAAWNSTDAAAESRLFWQHVRLAGLAAGPTDLADPLFTPRNVMGGTVGISSALASQLQIAGMSGQYQVCSAAIPGRSARQLDIMLDDGDTAKGSLRVVADGAALQSPPVATAAIVDNDSYTVCMTF